MRGVILALAAVWCGTGLAQAPAKYALLVAVDRYEHDGLSVLECPELDAQALAKVLRAAGYEVDTLLGSQASKPAITAKLETFARRGNRAGVALIGLFGHGVQPADKSYFCPHDAPMRAVKDAAGQQLFAQNGKALLEPDPEGLVPLESALTALSLSPAGNRVLLADCCRNDPTRARGRDAGFGASLTVNALPKNCAVVLACDKGQQAFENKAEWGHGAFTKGLLDGIARLQTAGQAATMGTLIDQVTPEVEQLVKAKNGEEQTPKPLYTGRVDLQLASLALPRRPERAEMKLVPKAPAAGAANKTSKSAFCGMEFVRIPGLPGKPELFVGKYVCTQGEWEKVMGTTPWKEKHRVKEGPRFAATYVSATDADEFCKKLSARDGVQYRLLTEQEWEHACRAGTTTEYSFGDDATKLGEYAWYVENTWGIVGRYAHEVGQKLPNPWGLYDMHGNTWEWTSTADGAFRVRRGGGWDDAPGNCRSANRDMYAPEIRILNLGFRVARGSGTE